MHEIRELSVLVGRGAALFLPPASTLVLEDSPPGIAAAKGAGAFAVGLPHEHSPG